MSKKVTVKLTGGECEALQNIFNVLKGKEIDAGQINYDVVKFDAILKQAREILSRNSFTEPLDGT